MSVHRMFTTLSLAVLCLSSATAARAASVTGGGRLTNTTAIAVSASSGSGGFLRRNSSAGSVLGDVVDLVVVGNVAVVAVQITESPSPSDVGLYFTLLVRDNGPTGDEVSLTQTSSVPPTSDELSATAAYYYGYPFPLGATLSGNISVTP